MNIVHKERKFSIFASILCLVFFLSSTAYLSQKPKQEQAGKHEVVFLLDVSNSMNTTDPSGLAPDSIEEIVSALPSNYTTGFIAYGNGLQVVENLNIEREPIKGAIRGVQYTGYTNAGAGLEKAIQLFSKDSGPKSIVLISDGEIMMENETATKESLGKFIQARREAANRGIRIYTIAVGDINSMPTANIYSADSSQAKNFTIAAADQLPEIMKKVLYEDFGVQKNSVSSGEFQSGSLKIKIPVEHVSYIDRAKVLITTDRLMENVAANYNAQHGEISIGKRFALVDVTRPQINEMEIRLGSSVGSTIRADLIMEIKAKIEVEVKPSIAASEDSSLNVDISLIPVGVEDENQHFLDDTYFEGKSIRVNADGEEITAKVSKGAINFPLSAQNTRNVQLIVHFEDLGINVIAPEKIFVQVNRPEGYGKYLMMISIAIAAIGLFIWYKNRKPTLPVPPPLAVSRYDFAGKLQIYISKSPDDSDIAPQIYNLSRRYTKEEISLGSILEQCGIKLSFPGEYKIWFSPGASKALVVTNKSDCTILKNRDLLIKDHSCLLYFEERLHITFEDESSEMILYYKNVKPSDK